MSFQLLNLPVHPPVEPQLGSDAAKTVILHVGGYREDPDHILPRLGIPVDEPGRHFATRSNNIWGAVPAHHRTLKNGAVVAPLVYIHFPHLVEHLYLGLPAKKQCYSGRLLSQFLRLPIAFKEGESGNERGCRQVLHRLNSVGELMTEQVVALIAHLKKVTNYKTNGVLLTSDWTNSVRMLVRGNYKELFPLIRMRFPRLEFTVEQFGAYRQVGKNGMLAGEDGRAAFIDNNGTLGDTNMDAEDIDWAQEIGIFYKKRKLGLLLDFEWTE